jgi:hypothetical protein
LRQAEQDRGRAAAPRHHDRLDEPIQGGALTGGQNGGGIARPAGRGPQGLENGQQALARRLPADAFGVDIRGLHPVQGREPP